MDDDSCSSCELGQAAKRRREEEDTTATADRLINLPNPILNDILSYLDTKTVVQTSVLSRAWRSTWKNVTTLSFRSDSFQQYSNFQTYVHKVLSLHDPVDLSLVAYINNENLEERDDGLFVKVIKYALTHGTQHLVIDLFNEVRNRGSCMFSYLFGTVSNYSLKGLLLRRVVIDSGFASAGFQMLTDLTLITCLMFYGEDGAFEFDPFSCFPCLKHLDLRRCVDINYYQGGCSVKISGPELRTLKLDYLVSSKIEICGPKLEFFSLTQNLESLNFSNISVPSLEHVDIQIYDVGNSIEAKKESMTQSLMHLFQGLSTARTVMLSSKTIQIMSNMDSEVLKQQPSPFTRLKSLIVLADTVPYLLLHYFLKGSSGVKPTVQYV